MPLVTPNPTITKDWELVVPAGSEFLLSLPFRANTGVEIAVMETEEAPDESGGAIFGHRIDPTGHEGITRSLVGPGYVYARTRDFSAVGTTVRIALTTWVEA